MALILFTGGGSAGHVTPNLAVIDYCQQHDWQVAYVGSHAGIEHGIIKRIHIPYHSITTGKLRRHWSFRHFLDPFKVLIGIIQATALCFKLKPALVFSKGGFVAFPVVVGAWLNRIPVICHEADFTPGLANRLSFPFAKKICITYPGSEHFFGYKNKLAVTGAPLRASLFAGNKARGLKRYGFSAKKPVIMVYGGSLGSANINQVVRELLPDLLPNYQVIHLCGQGKLDPKLNDTKGYVQLDYVHQGMDDIFAMADIVISRSGSNSVNELVALRKPHILIPLSKKASRGDQIVNAKYFADLGLSRVIADEKLTAKHLGDEIDHLFKEREAIVQKLEAFELPDSLVLIYDVICEAIE